MRLSVLVTTVAFAVTAPTRTASHQWIVIGTNGQIVDVDPSPYMPESRRLRKRQQQEEREAEERRKNALQQSHTDKLNRARAMYGARQVQKDAVDDGFFDDNEEEPIAIHANDTESHASWEPVIPDIETLIITDESVDGDDAWHDVFTDDDEMSIAAEEYGDDMYGTNVSYEPPPTFLMNLLVALEDDSNFPAVQGSVVFAELSCLFVAFIAYLVHSVPLCSSFPLGQRCCLFVAFSAALLYQLVAVGWYYDVVSPDVTLSISSLITRTISLGMVPITTTSFIGRARTVAEIASSQDKPLSAQVPVRTKSSRHRKARSN